MLHVWRNRFSLPGRHTLLIGLVLVVVLAAGLAGAILLLQRHGAPAFRHVPNAPNLGTSLLSLTTPTDSLDAAGMTRLTMLRISDGAVLWQDDLPGVLPAGGTGSIEEALQTGTLQIANGVIYVALDDAPATTSTSPQSLLALRASDGTLLWRQEVQAACAQMVGVSDGVVICSGATSPNPGSTAAPTLAFSGYDAQTGKRVWRRASSEITGHGVYTPPTLIDGVLYVSDTPLNLGGGQRRSTFYALEASTGRMLWSYGQVGALSGPIAGKNGSP